MKKLVIAVISGGVSPERHVSLNSGAQACEALNKKKYEIVRYDPMTDLPKLVNDAEKIDAALILLHGKYGEDGTVQGMLDLLGIPYQGSGVLGSAVAMNKILSKYIYEKNSLPVPRYVALKRGDPADAGALAKKLGFPLVIKPAETGSSVGMSMARTTGEIENGLALAFSHGDAVLAEKYIAGLEITAGVIGNDTLDALPLIEIIPGKDRDFFDYDAKYTEGATREICPARIDEKYSKKARQYAKLAHRALFCEGYSRTDMILKDGQLYLLETNTIPGMTRTSLLPQAAEKAGIPFDKLLDTLISLGMEARHACPGSKI